MIIAAAALALLAAPPFTPVWTRLADGRELSFVVPNSDDFQLTLYCRSKERVEISVPAPHKTPKTITLSSGGVRKAYGATTNREELEISEAHTRIDDPVLQRFRRSGKISVDAYSIDARTRSERAAIDAFFAVCR